MSVTSTVSGPPGMPSTASSSWKQHFLLVSNTQTFRCSTTPGDSSYWDVLSGSNLDNCKHSQAVPTGNGKPTSNSKALLAKGKTFLSTREHIIHPVTPLQIFSPRNIFFHPLTAHSDPRNLLFRPRSEPSALGTYAGWILYVVCTRQLAAAAVVVVAAAAAVVVLAVVLVVVAGGGGGGGGGGGASAFQNNHERTLLRRNCQQIQLFWSSLQRALSD